VSSDAARDRVVDVLARLRDQLSDFAAMQRKQAALELNAQAADGTVEVTVNARGQLIKTVIDNSYLDDHDFDELGGYITEAAQAAVQDVGQRVAEMLAPINERYRNFPTFSDIVEGIPDPSDLMPPGLDAFAPASQRQDTSVSSAGGRYDDGDGDGAFPTVKR
jgi:DNA-binding protein YbaB